MKRKRISVMLSIILVCLCFAGCNSSNQTSQQTTNVSGKYVVSKDPMTLTFFYAGYGGPFKDDYPVYKKAAELTNVTLKGTVPLSNSDSQQAFNIMMSSGELSDIVAHGKASFDKYIGQGAFVPLNDLIEQHAPNIKKFFKENPHVKRGITSCDGNIYFLPKVEDGITAKGWFIRKDWLDALNLPIPTTVEEYYNTLVAFRDGDPNKNGRKDEVPYFSRSMFIDDLLNLYGLRKDFYDQDGKVVHSKYLPEYKQAISNVAKWYKEGLVDKEIFTRGNNAREMLFGDNVGGSVHDWFTTTTAFNERLKEKIPGFELIAIAPPADINGKVWEDTSRTANFYSGWGISSSNKHPIETIKYFDFWFSEVGRTLDNFGVEGIHHDLVDGKPKYKEELLKNGNMNAALWGEGMCLTIGGHQDFESEKQWMQPSTVKSIEMYVDNNYILPQFPRVPFTPEEQKVVSEKLTPIDSYMSETEQKWLLGVEDVDASYDAYISNLKKMGMDEVLEIYNTAYNRYKSFK